MRRVIKRQRTIVGRLVRDIARKATPDQMAQLAETMHRARRLKEQKTKTKNKLYSFHAPDPHRHPSFPTVGCGILGIRTRGLSEGFDGLFNRAQAGGAAQAAATV